MAFVDLRPDYVRLVRVLVDGEWREGDLEAYRRDPDGTWCGWVRWNEGVGDVRLGWFGEDSLRAVEANDRMG